MTFEAPTHLAGYVVPVESDDDLVRSFELRSGSGSRTFSLRYAGALEELEGQLLIVAGEDGAPPLVVAVAADDGEEIVVFDGAEPGYAAGFTDDDLVPTEDDDEDDETIDATVVDEDAEDDDNDAAQADQDDDVTDVDAEDGDAVSMLLEVRQAPNAYTLPNGETTFRIRIDYEDGIDWEEFVESAGGDDEQVELASGQTVSLAQLQRDGYVAISIVATVADGEEFIVLDEDLTV